ncbi:MAG: hypothetical protein JO265_04435 [Acidimicrobiia bacterium]|nr:hypothetical protein [Acidimicrobiia bacterium]
MTRLVIAYFAVAAIALVVALGTFALSSQHTTAQGEEILQLHITRYHG